MAKIITVDINGQDWKALLKPDEDWQHAALRAIQRKYGKGASVWGWTLDSRAVNRRGDVIQHNYKGTVVGKQERGGGYPILCEARVYLPVTP